MAVRIEWKLDKVMTAIDRRVRNNMERACIFLEGEVKLSMKPGRGRIYRRRSVIHRASAPGYPPAVDTGQYRQSITHEVKRKGRLVIGRVGTNMKKGKWLEFGTRYMAPRPHLRPGFYNNRGRLVRIIIGRE